jgi:hypothetical protein
VQIQASTGIQQSAKRLWNGADADNSALVDPDEFHLFMQRAMEDAGQASASTALANVQDLLQGQVGAAPPPHGDCNASRHAVADGTSCAGSRGAVLRP